MYDQMEVDLNGKDAYWFPHDANASSDPKCQALIGKHGMEGYGRFWNLIEMLRDSSQYRLPDLPFTFDALAMRWQCDCIAAESFVRELHSRYGLIIIEDGYIFSVSLCARMESWDVKREKNAQNANKRWSKERPQCDRNATAMQEEDRTGEKSTEEKEEPKRLRFVPPSLDECKAQCIHIGIPESEAGKFILYHEARGWMLSKSKMKSWKAAMGTWKGNYEKFNTKSDASTSMYRATR